MVWYSPLLLALALLSPALAPPAGHPGVAADSLVGIFEGRTPCGPVATDFTGFPAATCEKIKWRLTLYRDSPASEAGHYLFKGTRATRQGRWRAEPGTGALAGLRVYRLEYDGPRRILSLLRIEDVLLVLDQNGKVMSGDASWSYALNRTDLQAR